MANNLNLTPERKAQLRKEVIAEISKNEIKKVPVKKPRSLTAARPQPLKVSAPKKITPAPKTPPVQKSLVPMVVKSAVPSKPPVIVKKPISSKPSVVKKIIKKPVSQPVKKISVPPKPTVIKPAAKTAVRRWPPDPFLTKKETWTAPESLVKPVLKKPVWFKVLAGGDRKIFTKGLITFISLTLVFILLLAVDIFGIYRLDWDNQANRVLLNLFSLPAGQVNGRIIKLADYLDDLKTIEATLASQTNAPVIDQRILKEQLFNRLVSLNIIDYELKKYNLSVTSEILDQELQNTISQIGDLEKTTEEIKKVYGLTPELFKKNVLKPILDMNLLQQAITQDNDLPLNKQAGQQANEALKLALTPGTDFETLVLQYSNDVSTTNNKGDLGWFKRGELSKEAEDILFSLESGMVYDQVF